MTMKVYLPTIFIIVFLLLFGNISLAADSANLANAAVATISASSASGSDTATFGVSSAATEGFDATFDMAEPPAPPSDYIRAYFSFPDSAENYAKELDKSIFPIKDNINMKLIIEYKGQNQILNLSWNVAELGKKFSTILLGNSGTRVNMKANNEYRFNASSGTYEFFVTLKGMSDSTATQIMPVPDETDYTRFNPLLQSSCKRQGAACSSGSECCEKICSSGISTSDRRCAKPAGCIYIKEKKPYEYNNMWVYTTIKDTSKDFCNLGINSRPLWVCGHVVASKNEKYGFYFEPNTTTVAENTIEAMQTNIYQISQDPGYFEKNGFGPLNAGCIPAGTFDKYNESCSNCVISADLAEAVKNGQAAKVIISVKSPADIDAIESLLVSKGAANVRKLLIASAVSTELQPAAIVEIKDDSRISKIELDQIVGILPNNIVLNLGCPDINSEGIVNIIDASIIGKSMNMCSGNANYNSTADINRDGCVNQKDLDVVTSHFGQSTICSQLSKCPDINKDGKIDVVDASFIGKSMNLCEGQPGYDSEADITADGCVDNGDMIALGKYFNIPLLQISQCETMSNNVSCTDSDKGDNPLEYGVCTEQKWGGVSNKLNDTCSAASDTAAGVPSGRSLLEYYCSFDKCETKNYDCNKACNGTGTCENGRCSCVTGCKIGECAINGGCISLLESVTCNELQNAMSMQQTQQGIIACPDLNGDNVVNVVDFSYIGKAYRACAGAVRYNLSADVNDDGCVNILDLAWLSKNFRKNTDCVKTCYDFDGGNNPEKTGRVSYNLKNYMDFCADNNLTEFYCAANHTAKDTYNCSSYCKSKYGEYLEGACSIDARNRGYCSCTSTINQKKKELYSNKTVFLTSDEDWRTVLAWVPVAVWTNKSGEVEKYPFLTYDRGRYFGSEDASLSVSVRSANNIVPTFESEDNCDLIGYFKQTDYITAMAEGSGVDNVVIQDFPGKFHANLRLKNCGVNTASIDEVNLSINHPNYGNFITPKNIVLRNNGTLEPGATKNLTFEFTIEKADSFDADSVIYFLQQFRPSNLVLVGDSPQELDNVLVAQPSFGAGIPEDSISRTSPDDYLSYWNYLSEIVVVDYNNYADALMASVFASYKNAPIVFINKTNLYNYNQILDGKNVYVVGEVDADVSLYLAQYAQNVVRYDTKTLLSEYLKNTRTDKVILLNPNDLNLNAIEAFTPEKSVAPIYKLYSKTSLIAPILASAKHELIITINSSDYKIVNATFKSILEELGFMPGYLTVFASPIAITMSYCNVQGLQNCPSLAWYGTDRIFANIDDDSFTDMLYGRLFGLTSSDVAGYVARDLFYNFIYGSDKNSMYVGKDFEETEDRAAAYAQLFREIGDNTTSYVGYPTAMPKDYENKQVAVFMDHGTPTGLHESMNSREIPLMANTFMFTDACLTCAYNSLNDNYDFLPQKQDLFCANFIRNGGLGIIASVGPTSGFSSWVSLASLYSTGILGNVIPNDIRSSAWPIFILLGDPALTLPLNNLTVSVKKTAETPTSYSFLAHLKGGVFNGSLLITDGAFGIRCCENLSPTGFLEMPPILENKIPHTKFSVFYNLSGGSIYLYGIAVDFKKNNTYAPSLRYEWTSWNVPSERIGDIYMNISIDARVPEYNITRLAIGGPVDVDRIAQVDIEITENSIPCQKRNIGFYIDDSPFNLYWIDDNGNPKRAPDIVIENGIIRISGKLVIFESYNRFRVTVSCDSSVGGGSDSKEVIV